MKRGRILKVRPISNVTNISSPQIYNGSLPLLSGEDFAVKDDAALVALGIQPIPTNALTSSTARTHQHHELDAVRSQREFLKVELKEATEALQRTKAEVAARECDMSNLSEEVERLRSAAKKREKEKVELQRKLYEAKELASKVLARERSYEKSGEVRECEERISRLWQGACSSHRSNIMNISPIATHFARRRKRRSSAPWPSRRRRRSWRRPAG